MFRKLRDFLFNKEVVAVGQAVLAVAIVIEEYIAENGWNTKMLLGLVPLIIGAVQRQNVWSRDSVNKINHETNTNQ